MYVSIFYSIGSTGILTSLAKRDQAFGKKLLILVVSDGAPTNEHGETDVGTLEAVLRNERTPQTNVTFLACTDDLDSVDYLSNLDK